jgi:hypothetical protein
METLMENFVPEVAQNTGEVAPQAALNTPFRPLNPGLIKVTSIAQPGRPGIRPRIIDRDGGGGGNGGEDSIISRRTELFRPGNPNPVASKTEAPFALSSTIEYNATPDDLRAPGNWTCRVTNLEDAPLKFTGKAEFPGRTVLKQHVIRLGSAMEPGFNQFIQGIVAKLGVKIHLQSGKATLVNLDGTTREIGQSTIDFSEEGKREFGLKTLNFELPSLGGGGIRDVNSQYVEVSLQGGTPKFPGGYVQFVARFEESGKEITGKNEAHLKNIVLTMRLGLAVVQEKLALGQVEASFPVKVDPTGLLGNIADIFVDFNKKVQRAVEQLILFLVDKPLGDPVPGQPPPPTMRLLVNDLFGKGLQLLLGGKKPRVHKVVADAQTITIYYF